MPECTCISCNSKFFNRSWNAKFCNDCKNALINFENLILHKGFDESYFYGKDYYKFENENGSGFIILHYKIKENYNPIDYYFKKCSCCQKYVHVNTSKGFGVINYIKEGGITTCSYKCKNILNQSNGIQMKCIYCNDYFKSHNPNQRICNDCKDNIENLNNFMKNNINYDQDFENYNLDIIEDFENENNGRYRIIKYNLKLHNNKIYTFYFYFKKCKICNQWVLLTDHIDRIINSIKNENKPTFCSNECNLKNLEEIRKDGFTLICRNCKKEYHSESANNHYCHECQDIINYVNNNFVNLNEDDWLDKINDHNLKILEEYGTDKGKYKIIKYKGIKFILKWCFKCHKWNITNERRTPIFVKNGGYTFCCPEHSNVGKQNFINLSVLCYKDEPVKDIIKKLNDKIYDIKDFPGWNLRYCTNCQKLEWHYGTECLICGNKNKLTNSKFVKIKGINYYKTPDGFLINYKTLLNKIQNNEFNIKNFPGLNKRFCIKCNEFTWHYKKECLVCGTINFINKHKMINRNGILYYNNELVTDIISKLDSKEYNEKDYTDFNKRYCENCQEFEWHYGTKCIICGNKNKLTNYKFVEIKGLKHYKMPDGSLIDCRILADKILKNELNISDFPGFNIRFGKVCKDTEDIITGEILLLDNSNFINYKNIEYILDYSTGQRVPSKEFYDNFDKKVKNMANSNNEIKELINNEGFNVESIIKYDNETWNRDQTDKNLINKGYKYICYIKLFHEKPWIVGKTSTTLIPASPVDFDFKIYNPNNLDDPNYNGAGRTYVHRYYPDELYSDFDYVLCKNFETEKEALKFEKYIAKKYRLFQS